MSVDVGERLADLAHAHGMRLSIEGSNGTCDDLRYLRRADEPMGEFWGYFNRGRTLRRDSHSGGSAPGRYGPAHRHFVPADDQYGHIPDFARGRQYPANGLNSSLECLHNESASERCSALMQKASKRKKATDRLDMRILTALSERGRQTLTELSKTVGLSATPCGARVDQLEEQNIILGYHADVDIEGIADLSLYFVTIALNPYSADLARKLEALMAACPFIVAADALFGSIDYILRVYARSTQHYHAIMAPFVELGVDYETWPVSRKIMAPKTHRLIGYLTNENG